MDSIDGRPVASYSLRELWLIFQEQLRALRDHENVSTHRLVIIELLAHEGFRRRRFRRFRKMSRKAV